MRGLLFLTMAIALAFGPAAAHAEDAPLEIQGARTVNADGVIDLVRKTDQVVIVDNRTVADYEAGHIEGAINLIDTDIANEATLARHVKSRDTPVLFYCNGVKCGRAAKASARAVEWGYTKVYYYALGLQEWRDRHLPLVR